MFRPNLRVVLIYEIPEAIILEISLKLPRLTSIVERLRISRHGGCWFVRHANQIIEYQIVHGL